MSSDGCVCASGSYKIGIITPTYYAYGTTLDFLGDFGGIRAEPLFWISRTKLSVLVLKQNVDYNAIRGPVPRDLGQTRRYTNDELAVDEVSLSHSIHMSYLRIHRQSFGTKADGKPKALSTDERSHKNRRLFNEFIDIIIHRSLTCRFDSREISSDWTEINRPAREYCLMGGWWGHYSFRCQPVDYSNSPTAIKIGMSGWLTGEYSLKCQPVDYSERPQVLRMVHASWWYYFSKFTEFMDTIFFVLRKKNNHVSTLHVIHHGCMPMSVWFGVKFTPGGHSTFFGLLNTFVHIVMYTYYLLAALGPRIQPYLWWKKYLTAFQMIQFIAIMIHAFQLLFIDCDYPKAFVWWIGMHAVMFFFLFNEFYQQNYQQKRTAKKTSSNGITNSRANGVASNGNIASNGTIRRDAADYYVKGESLAATEFNLRKGYLLNE
ncbi:elongation of very long chain fatty acids protein AAEL008004-like isoform X1 [Vespula squamosa]|uniref:Elongation of very long chain fatty acids protein n=1 Tax=Vespula squamosa TaxID=30214 RepID=A0ABD2AWP2_VESSQ